MRSGWWEAFRETFGEPRPTKAAPPEPVPTLCAAPESDPEPASTAAVCAWLTASGYMVVRAQDERITIRLRRSRTALLAQEADYLRLLLARQGVTVSPVNEGPIQMVGQYDAGDGVAIILIAGLTDDIFMAATPPRANCA